MPEPWTFPINETNGQLRAAEGPGLDRATQRSLARSAFPRVTDFT